MNTLLQIKVTDETARKLEYLVAELRQTYAIRKQELDLESQRAALAAKGKEEGLRIVANYEITQKKFRALGLRISMQNVVRLFLEAGLAQYDQEISKLLDAVGEHGVTRGRPTGT